MMENKFFTAKKINGYTTMITGLSGENCILFEGSERALLFDGLTGTGSLKAFVRELTDLPVFLAVSHAHVDHEGAAFEYGECFLHPDDIGLFYSERSGSIESRLGFANNELPYAPPHRIRAVREDVVPPCAVKTYPVYDGDCFDIGGVMLEVIHVPGHSRGSIVLLDRAAKALYSADAVNPNTLLHLPGSTSIEEYLDSLRHLKEFQPAFQAVYTGHSDRTVPASIVDDAIELCGRILARTDEKIPEEGLGGSYLRASAVTEGFLPACGGYSNICYREDHIYGRKGSAVLKGRPYVDGM